MDCKMRPMSEAPLNVPLLLADPNRPSGWTYGEFSTRDSMHKFNGFFVLSDLLRAAEILAEITPEGCEFESTGITRDHTDDEMIKSVRVYFRRIAAPVEYEFVTDGKLRLTQTGDWVLEKNGEWRQVWNGVAGLTGEHLCFRRVEVKR